MTARVVAVACLAVAAAFFLGALIQANWAQEVDHR